MPASSGDIAMKDYVMLYSVAVTEGKRRGRVGAQLLGKMEDVALKAGSKTVYGVTSADSAAFYKARGYQVQKPDEMFRTYWGESEVAFSISGDAQWFSKGLKRRSSSWLTNLFNP
ncbi:hypothetical protein GCM10025778_14960 [Paeniglutamicibacter antarcticus]|uniref:N-acetyltransferase domain-containing protein n=1 Tax=Paeniglutamicibacter antarcticus TaxID=494023 RepID=A0ABP9TMH1_9MICC